MEIGSIKKKSKRNAVSKFSRFCLSCLSKRRLLEVGLGLFTASNLSWNQHVDKITAKANRVLGLVKRTCRDLKAIDTMKTLYCSLVRPLLEYSCETWNPRSKRNIDKLEAVQRRATRWID